MTRGWFFPQPSNHGGPEGRGGRASPRGVGNVGDNDVGDGDAGIGVEFVRGEMAPPPAIVKGVRNGTATTGTRRRGRGGAGVE